MRNVQIVLVPNYTGIERKSLAFGKRYVYVSFSRLILVCFSKPLINFTMSKIILQASIHYQQCVPAVRSEIY